MCLFIKKILLGPTKGPVQQQVPLRLPCYDFIPITNHRLLVDSSKTKKISKPSVPSIRNQFLGRDGRSVLKLFRYSPQHGHLRLLAIPTSCSRISENNPNLSTLYKIYSNSHYRITL